MAAGGLGNGAAVGSSQSPAAAPNRQTGSPAAAPSPQQGGGAAAPAGSGGGATPPTTSAGNLPLQASFSSPCVRAGTPQTITVKTIAKAGIAYNSVYADGNNSRDNKTDYYGGNKGGQADDTGVYRDTWTLSPRAARGPVHVDVVGIAPQGQSGYAVAGFTVAGPDGKC